jgi:tetratricopeptide (TPR) repeat protein
MTTPHPNPQGIAKVTFFFAFTIIALGIAAGLCYVLIPFYAGIESRVLLGEGMSTYIQGQDNHAIAELNQAVALDPKNAQAFYYRGLTYSRKEDYDHAVADFNRAIQLNPQDEQVLYDCGLAYENKSDFKNALDIYNKAVTLHPQSALANNDYAWLLATCPQADIRDGKKAVEYATKACTLSNWKDAPSLDTLAAADAEVGDFNGAVKWEIVAMASSGFSENDAAGAKVRLALYQSHQPYHRADQ